MRHDAQYARDRRAKAKLSGNPIPYGGPHHYRGRDYVEIYKSTHPCVDCGEADPRVLEFDHREGTTKNFIIGQIISKRSFSDSLKDLIDEIAKCDVRCANCHRRRHHKERLSRRERIRKDS